MLNKIELQAKIELAIYNAMKSALIEMGNEMKRIAEGSKDGSDFSVDSAIEKFASEAKNCSSDIANAIDSYVKSARVTMNLGTIITPMPTLVSPAGPVTGTITLAAPTFLDGAIS